ncbi:alpha/beta-hydrolase [Durotheca rogersii]|uniref:alpha/beta-hydrolase n=1 Tax=Durotheca rogersii TaxID=419775 RepID=UPI00221E7B9E|nr:alpha/beta-hydrolase [Durotheca rogersii]KAI5861230.1 alpha/beta-hydrolase [Durotheca rogersii]
MDFSEYGTLSEEWVDFEKNNSEAAGWTLDIGGGDPVKLQAQGNIMTAAMGRAKLERSGLWAVVEFEDYTATSRDGYAIPVRCYRPKAARGRTLPAHVHYHGGGYTTGDLETDECYCVAWAHALSAAVVSVNYRHTPQVSGLVPFHDAIDAFDWIAGHAAALGADPERLTVGGISAGGGLAAAVVVHEVRQALAGGAAARVRGQVLAIPNVVQEFPFERFADRGRTSLVQCAGSPLLPKIFYDYMVGLLRAGHDTPANHPTWNPGLVEDEVLRSIPPTAMLVCGSDLLRDEGLMYASRLRDAGVPTKVHIFDGMPHGFYLFDQLASTTRWEEIVRESTRWAGSKEGEWFVEVPPQKP